MGSPRRPSAPVRAAVLLPPAVCPLWPCSLKERGDHPARRARGGVAGKGGFQRGKTEGGNSIAGAARRVWSESASVQVRP